jgi:hypothetical protein
MPHISITKRYDLLSSKLGKESAENLTTFIERKISADLESKTQILATKEDLAKIEANISESKSEIIKGMFILWIGQVLATFGFILLYLRN